MKATEPPPPPHRYPTILIVDDEPMVRGILDQFLRRHGFPVYHAASGAEAIDLCRRQPDVGLALIEVHLRGELTGPQTLATLRYLRPHLRCWLTNAFPGQPEDGELLSHGAEAVIAKPFHPRDLTAALVAWVSRPIA